MGEVRKALNQPEVIEQTLNKINRIEEEEKKRLEGERVGEEEEIGKLKSAASRLLNADGVFAKEELARLECELAVRMNRLGQIDAELDSLNNAANSRDALTTELANLAPLWDELFPAEKRRIMALLFDRIDAYEDRLRITQAGNHNTFDIPMKIKRIGGRKKIIVPGDAQRESLPEDRRMAIAAALGHRWMGLLLDGRFNSVGELAEEIGIDPSLIRRHLGWTCVQARDIESMLGEG